MVAAVRSMRTLHHFPNWMTRSVYQFKWISRIFKAQLKLLWNWTHIGTSPKTLNNLPFHCENFRFCSDTIIFIIPQNSIRWLSMFSIEASKTGDGCYHYVSRIYNKIEFWVSKQLEPVQLVQKYLCAYCVCYIHHDYPKLKNRSNFVVPFLVAHFSLLYVHRTHQMHDLLNNACQFQ